MTAGRSVPRFNKESVMKTIVSLAILGLVVAGSRSVFAEDATDKMVAEIKSARCARTWPKTRNS